MVNGMAELATPAAWPLAKIAHRAISSRSALPSGHLFNHAIVQSKKHLLQACENRKYFCIILLILPVTGNRSPVAFFYIPPASLASPIP